MAEKRGYIGVVIVKEMVIPEKMVMVQFENNNTQPEHKARSSWEA